MLCGAFKAASRGDPESVRAVLAVMKHQERLRGVDGSPAVDGLPDFGELRASYLTDRDKLRNLDALLADLWALRDVAVQRITATPLGTDGKAPPALLAVLGEIAGALERVARIEGKIRDRDSISVPVVKA
jgi:hypothetical protein